MGDLIERERHAEPSGGVAFIASCNRSPQPFPTQAGSSENNKVMARTFAIMPSDVRALAKMIWRRAALLCFAAWPAASHASV